MNVASANDLYSEGGTLGPKPLLITLGARASLHMQKARSREMHSTFLRVKCQFGVQLLFVQRKWFVRM
jgi:hypothetical protein